MKVLITGGTGFIGSRLALQCLKNGEEVRVLGQENNSVERHNRHEVQAAGAEVVVGSIVGDVALPGLLEGIDVVFHLAACQHEANVPDQRFWDVNVNGTRNLLEASLQAGVRRFVHGSTIGVYGGATRGVIDEQSALNPANIYGITKLEGERVVQRFREKIPTVIVRISETYGPGDQRLLKLFKGIDKRIFIMIGKGENLHHQIYIDDLVEGLILAAKEGEAVGKMLPLAGKEPVTTNQMVGIIAKVLGKSVRGFRAPMLPFLFLAVLMEKTLRPLGIQPPLHRRRMDFFIKSFVLSQEAARQVLKFIPKVSFEQGAAETAKWYKRMGYL